MHIKYSLSLNQCAKSNALCWYISTTTDIFPKHTIHLVAIYSNLREYETFPAKQTYKVIMFFHITQLSPSLCQLDCNGY